MNKMLPGVGCQQESSQIQKKLQLNSIIKEGHYPQLQQFLQDNSDFQKTEILTDTLFELMKVSKLQDDYLECLRILLNYNAHPNEQGKDEGKTVLMIASKKGQFEAVNLLLDYNAKQCYRCKQGKNALFYAIEGGRNYDIVEILLSKEDCDINNKSEAGQTALMLAVEQKYDQIVQLLLQKDADPNIQNNQKETALHIAVRQQNKIIIQALLEKNSDIYCQNSAGKSALDLCQNDPELQVFIKEYSQEIQLKKLNIFEDDKHKHNNQSKKNSKKNASSETPLKASSQQQQQQLQQNEQQPIEQQSVQQENKQPQKEKEEIESLSANENQTGSKQSSELNQSSEKQQESKQPLENNQDSENVMPAQPNQSQKSSVVVIDQHSEEANLVKAKQNSGLQDPQQQLEQQISKQQNMEGDDQNKTTTKNIPDQDQVNKEVEVCNDKNNDIANQQGPNQEIVAQQQKSPVHQTSQSQPDQDQQQNTIANQKGPDKDSKINEIIKQTQDEQQTLNSENGVQESQSQQISKLEETKVQNQNQSKPEEQQFKTVRSNNGSYNVMNNNQNNLYSFRNKDQKVQQIDNQRQKGSNTDNDQDQSNGNNFKYGSKKSANNCSNQNSSSTNNLNSKVFTKEREDQPTKLNNNNNLKENNTNLLQHNQIHNKQVQADIPNQNVKSSNNNNNYNEKQPGPKQQQNQHKKLYNQSHSNHNNTCSKKLETYVRTQNDLYNIFKNTDMLLKQKNDNQKIQELELQLKQKNYELETLKSKLHEMMKKEKDREEIKESMIDSFTQTEKSKTEFIDCAKQQIYFQNNYTIDQILQNRLFYHNQELKHILQSLTMEIQNFCAEVKADQEKQKPYFDELVKSITEIIQNNIPSQVEVYGSYATELCLSFSDIDLLVTIKNNNQMQNAEMLQYIEKILKDNLHQTYAQRQQRQDSVIQNCLIKQTNLIKSANIPVLKLTIQFNGKDNITKEKRVDITLYEQKHNGFNCVMLVRKFLKHYQPLKELALTLKQLIYSLHQYEPYKGGLSSYGLLLMIVAFIQNFYDQRQWPPVGQLLYEFLQHYGFQMDYTQQQIYSYDPDTEPQIPNFSTVNQTQFDYINGPIQRLIVMDPLNQYNNVGRPTYKIHLIRKAFQLAYYTIHQKYFCDQCQYNQDQKLNMQQDFYKPCFILKRIFNLPTEMFQDTNNNVYAPQIIMPPQQQFYQQLQTLNFQ